MNTSKFHKLIQHVIFLTITLSSYYITYLHPSIRWCKLNAPNQHIIFIASLYFSLSLNVYIYSYEIYTRHFPIINNETEINHKRLVWVCVLGLLADIWKTFFNFIEKFGTSFSEAK